MIIVGGKVLAQNVTPEEIGLRLFRTVKLTSFLGTNTLEPILAQHLTTYLQDELDLEECSQALASVVLTEAANLIISLAYCRELTPETTDEEMSALKLKGLAEARDFFRTYTLALDPATLASVYGIEVDKNDPNMNPIIN